MKTKKVKKKVYFSYEAVLYMNVLEVYKDKDINLLLIKYLYKPLDRQFRIICKRLIDTKLKSFNKLLSNITKEALRQSKTKEAGRSLKVGKESGGGPALEAFVKYRRGVGDA